MLTVDLSKCTGCKRCECACAFFRTSRISNRMARIKVVNLYEIGIDGPVACGQCEERYCDCCPSSAISKGAQGEVVVSPTLCGLCGACEKACPIGAIEIFDELVYVCDLCGGRPKCVEVCTEGAISATGGEGGGRPSVAMFKKKALGMNAAEKRALYVKTMGAEVRKRWGKTHA